MDSAERSRAESNFRLALELFELGEKMTRERLRRENPGASEAEIERLLVAWLQERPGAEFGDCPGRLISLPRTRK